MDNFTPPPDRSIPFGARIPSKEFLRFIAYAFATQSKLRSFVGGLTLAGQIAVGMFWRYERKTRAIANLVQAHRRIAEDAVRAYERLREREASSEERLMEQVCGSEISWMVPDLRVAGNPTPRHHGLDLMGITPEPTYDGGRRRSLPRSGSPPPG